MLGHEGLELFIDRLAVPGDLFVLRLLLQQGGQVVGALVGHGEVHHYAFQVGLVETHETQGLLFVGDNHSGVACLAVALGVEVHYEAQQVV